MSPDEAVVHVNRDAPGSIASPENGLETQGSFALRLVNHGDPAHVHCRLDGDLTAVASTIQANYFVSDGDETLVPIDVADVDSPVSGTLDVSTRYGAEATTVAVTVTPGSEPVAVDESLSSPPADEPDPTLDERTLEAMTVAGRGPDVGTLAVLALALLTLLVGITAAATVGGPAAIVGGLVVATGVAVALALLVR